jgi:hypothetical protein
VKRRVVWTGDFARWVDRSIVDFFEEVLMATHPTASDFARWVDRSIVDFFEEVLMATHPTATLMGSALSSTRKIKLKYKIADLSKS